LGPDIGRISHGCTDGADMIAGNQAADCARARRRGLNGGSVSPCLAIGRV